MYTSKIYELIDPIFSATPSLHQGPHHTPIYLDVPATDPFGPLRNGNQAQDNLQTTFCVVVRIKTTIVAFAKPGAPPSH
jgi:hypothetical protein